MLRDMTLYVCPEHHSHNCVDVADTQRDKVADLLFDPDNGLGLEIIRYNIGGSDTDATAVNSLRPGAAVPSLLLPDGTYNWTLVSSPVGVW